MVDDVHFSTGNDEWETPQEIFDLYNGEFFFTVDAAASDINFKVKHYWTMEDDGLAQDWTGERVWCNPPYSPVEQTAFVKKAAECKADVAVLLLPARTDTKRWHDYIFPFAEVRFIKGRITFVGAEHPAPFPSAVAIFWKGRLGRLRGEVLSHPA